MIRSRWAGRTGRTTRPLDGSETGPGGHRLTISVCATAEGGRWPRVTWTSRYGPGSGAAAAGGAAGRAANRRNEEVLSVGVVADLEGLGVQRPQFLGQFRQLYALVHELLLRVGCWFGWLRGVQLQQQLVLRQLQRLQLFDQ